MLNKVISGGQTGVDQAALAAAKKAGIVIGGWAPKGFRCEDGVIPRKFSEYMWEADTSNYEKRTEMNVIEAQATIIYCHDIRNSRGTKLTVDMCKKHGKPWFDFVSETHMFESNRDGYEHFALLLEKFGIINVAGSRESKYPGIFDSAKERLYGVFSRLVIK